MRDCTLGLKSRLSAAIMFGALVAMPSDAHAGEGDDAEKPKRRGLIVTVEDSDDVDAAAPKKKQQGDVLSPPAEGASETEINAYLRALKKDVRDTQIAQKQASRAGDADEAMRLKEELRDKKALLKDEESRLLSRDVGLIAGGGVLTGLGGLSLLSSLVLVCVYGLSAVDGNAEDEYGWASLATLGGGALGLGAGIPMIVIGSRKSTRGADDEYEYARPLTPGGGPQVGLTLSLSF